VHDRNGTIVITRFWKNKAIIFIAIFVVLILCRSYFTTDSFAQSEHSTKDTANSTDFGRHLLREQHDFRLELFSKNEIESRIRRKVVCLSMFGELSGEYFSEHPIDSWKTVESALKDMSSFNRKSQKPQIRIIQKDSIFQSSLSDVSNNAPSNGFTKEFLQHTLNAGDIIIVLPRYD
jgi:hypothetical protein